MPIGNTPINQLNALPLVSAQSVGDPGDVVVVGNTIRRYWSPVALLGASSGNAGVAGNVADPFQPGARSGFITLMLDITGCNFFTCIMVMRAATAGNDLGIPSWLVAAQHVGIGLNGLSVTPGGGANSDLAFVPVGTVSVGSRLATAAGANQDRTGELSWSNNSTGSRMVGSARLYFHVENMPGTPTEQLWWPTLWGQG
jgi:hypothetical protein